MLILPPHIQRKPPKLLNRRSPRDQVEPRLIRPPIIVHDRLPQVVAVPQARSRDPHRPRVLRLHPVHQPAIPSPTVGRLRPQLARQHREDLLRLIAARTPNRVLRVLQHVQRGFARIRPHLQVHRVQIAQPIQPHHLRIHPAILRNIRRAIVILLAILIRNPVRLVRHKRCSRRRRRRRNRGRGSLRRSRNTRRRRALLPIRRHRRNLLHRLRNRRTRRLARRNRFSRRRLRLSRTLQAPKATPAHPRTEVVSARSPQRVPTAAAQPDTETHP